MSHASDVARSARPAVPLVEKFVGSESFSALFREGMALVEETAAYLDGAGREEARALPRALASAYAAESMRLTTRLMQLASWLLLQRAVNQGDLTRRESAAAKHKVWLAEQALASSPREFEGLPRRLQELALHSLRLQARILRIDQLIYAAPSRPAPEQNPVEAQLDKLRAAFADRA